MDGKTEVETIESKFDSFTRERKDIAILMINQHVRSRSPFDKGAHLTIITDSRHDTVTRGRLQRGVSHGARDTVKGPPIRPREGQRDETSAQAGWRVICTSRLY